ncbi:SMP-30/gluconolactonase/LRE family protein [Membranihabitans marinus]|uniref:SMP-30/gluconolactonase/LRE family protein n=1 Tax=Membranihabitans marinus TaxID=1227546 RepID=UPI001F38BF2D|nr:SMP-30/gluconolactonase/LRE family protein [Membranihabitans marinus]
MNSPVATRWEKYLDLDYYTEGPGLDTEGNLYFTTLTGGYIMKVSKGNPPRQWAQSPCPNGQRILSDGSHLVCETAHHEIVQFNAYGQKIKTWVAGLCAGEKVYSPNDLTIDESQGFYFTDSIRHYGKVFFVGWDGREEVIATDVDYPNGIALDAQSEWLYIAESHSNSILRVKLAGPGKGKGKPEVFTVLPFNPRPLDENHLPLTANLPDGIAFDQQGRLWVAHYGMNALQIIDGDGQWIGSAETGIPATSNLCFSKDFNSIYVTGGMGEPGPGRVHIIYIESLS